MIAEEAIRFLAHEAKRCRDKDSAEALCLWLPTMCRLMGLQPMDDFESLDFAVNAREELKLQEHPEPVSSY
jgi:hypothetical protein